jgi:CheY-like chemotaxis protein
VSERPPLPDDLLADIDRLAPFLTMLDHYTVLGVKESASETEIKTAYLRVIQRFHPDRWHARESGAHRKRMEAIFARATEAYEVLRRADTRLDYDRSLYEVRGIPRPSSQPKAAPPPPPPRAPSVTVMAKAVRLMGQLRPPTVPAPAMPLKPAVAPPPFAAMPAPAPSAGAHATSGPQRSTILVVEDDETLRKMLVRILSELGTVREACDGVEALALANEDPVPRLVVTDVMMPRMDGLELARRLKATPRTSHVPIVMLTAKSGAKDLIEGVNAGARVYVTKPFKVDDLKAKAKKAMGG